MYYNKQDNKKLILKFSYLIFFLFLLVNSSFAIFQPSFQLPITDYPSGDVNISGSVTASSSISFYINNDLINSFEVFSNSKQINLTGSISDILNVPVGSTIIFKNNDTSKIYKLNISNADNSAYKVLNNADTLEFTPYKIGDILYKDEQEGITKKISVVNTPVPFNINSIGNKLKNGKNSLKFVINPVHNGAFNSLTKTVNITYDKYLIDVTLNNYSKVINYNEIKLNGSINDATYPLYYLKNYEGEIANSGLLNLINLDNGKFNITVSNLNEGNNTIRFISTQKDNINIFTGDKKIKILVDTIPPTMNIESATYKTDVKNLGKITRDADMTDITYVNSNKLNLNISSPDAIFLNYTFNSKNYTLKFENNSVDFDLNLVKGKNNLTLTAIDIAGNIAIESHQILFDNTKPDLVSDSLKPKELFDTPKEAHFPFVAIEGTTTKPYVKVEVFTFPENSKDKNGKKVTCSDFESLFIRNLGQLDNQRQYGPEFNSEETQIVPSSLMFQKQTFTTDSDGKFGGGDILNPSKMVVIGLQESTDTQSDYYDSTTNENKESIKVKPVISKNNICFYLEDKFGNYKIKPFAVTLDAGNTMWKPGEVTTIPNTLYAGEIESTASSKVVAGDGNTQFGLMTKIHYIGSGTVTSFTGVKLSAGKNKDSKHIHILSSQMHYKLDKKTGDLIIYVPVEVLKLGIKPADYPNKFEFWIDARVTYTVDNTDIPIDTVNPIHIKAVLNVERPLDHTKWLTPESIEKYQGFLNKSIKFTKKASKVMGLASVAGVLTCTGAKFYYGAQMAIATSEGDEQERRDLEKKLYRICDRVACTASPKTCDGTTDSAKGSGPGIFNTNGKKKFNSADLLGKANIISNDKKNRKMAQFESLNIGEKCNYSNSGSEDGVLISGKSTIYDEGQGNFWKSTSTTSNLITSECVPATFDENGEVENINLNGVSGACFNPNFPQYDGTRCNFFTEDVDSNAGAGWNPADNVIESIRCGCLTDTYSHLKNYLKIQQGIYKCLEQAKFGEVEGSYCERLMGQAVCDVATSVIFNTLSQESSRATSKGKDAPRENIFITAIKGARSGDEGLNKRYRGSFLTQAGLSTDDIVNKACVAGITGDWSILTDNILSSIDQNEVEPVFGPLFPTSRLEGYDPLTGDLTISYRFTYGVLSGGQQVNSKVTFICNPDASHGNYCPADGIITSNEARIPSSIRTRTLFVQKGGSRQDTIILKDTKAKFRFNQMQIVHTYNLKGDSKTKNIGPVDILAKGELFAGCYFTAGTIGSDAGFHCDALFGDNALMSGYSIRKQETKLAPSDSFYPGNDVYVDLAYETRNGQVTQTGFDLVYQATCKNAESKDSTLIGYKSTNTGDISNKGGYNSEVIKLFKIPEIGKVETNKFQEFSLNYNDNHLDTSKKYKLEIKSTTQTTPPTSPDFNIEEATGFDKNTDPSKNILDNLILTGVDLSLKISSKTPLIVKLVEVNNPKNYFKFTTSDLVINSYTKFDTLQAGNCDLKLRILPVGEGGKISTPEQFKNYDPLNQDSSSIATNVKQTDLYDTTFTISRTPENVAGLSQFMIKNLKTNSIICVPNGGDNKINIKYIYQTPKTSNTNTKESISYTIALDRYALNVSNAGELSSGEDSLDIIFKDLDNLKKEEGVYDATFSYTISNIENKGTPRTDSIKFKINTKKDCTVEPSPETIKS